MSLDQPDGTMLLEEARRTLLEALLPLLPSDRRYEALMVANAMAIAGREAGQAGEAVRALLGDLAVLTGRTVDAGLSETEHAGLFAELEQGLARQIRGGGYDASGPQRDAVRRYLRRATMARLKISNPKASSP